MITRLLFDDLRCSCLEFEAGVGHEFFNQSLEFTVSLGAEVSISADGGEDVWGFGSNGCEPHFFEFGDFACDELVEMATDTGVKDGDLFFGGNGHVLLLLEQFSQLLTSVKQLLGGSIEIGTELGEGGDFTILGELKFEGTGDLLHGLDLGGGTDTGYGETDVNGRTDTLVEEFSFEENLAISDGDHIGGDVGGHITSLGLNNREGGKGAGTVVLVHLGCTLEETRVEIEDITGVGLTTWGTSEQQGHLTVSNSLLGEIVVDDETVHAVVTEVLTNSAAGVGSQELERCGIGSGGSNDDGVFKCIALAEESDDVGNSGPLLADSDVDAVERLVFVAELVGGFLVEDGVDGDGGLAGLSVTDDKFTLSTSNWDLN